MLPPDLYQLNGLKNGETPVFNSRGLENWVYLQKKLGVPFFVAITWQAASRWQQATT